MKISFFIGSMQRGGAERVISILAEKYRAAGWDVDIVLLLYDIVEYDLHPDITLVKRIGKHNNYLKNAFYWLCAVRRYLKQRRPDRVVSFIGRINALVLTAAMGLKLPVVVSERNDPKNDGRGRAMLWYCNQIYRQAKAIVYQTEHERSCFDKSLASKGHVIPNPVRVAAVKEGSSQTVATAGRLVTQKNQKLLVDAMALVHKKLPEVKCEIYGDGALQQQLQAQITQLGLTDTVLLQGSVTNIHERLARCGVFALTSDFEGLSNALIEAMMVGLPCITTDYPGARELIADGKTGLVVPLNDPESLAKAIIKLIENKDGCADALARQGQAFTERFRADTVLEQWQKVIEE